MGVTMQTTDGGVIHIDFSVRKNCYNREAWCYGMCYGCGCCVKNKKERAENRLEYFNELLDEQINFNLWDDQPELREIQEKNIKANIRFFKRKIRYYKNRLEKLEGEK